MTAPFRVGEDPLDALKAIRARRATPESPTDDPLEQLKIEQLKTMKPTEATGIHEEYRSGRLAKRMARENQNEREMVDAETPSYAAQALGGVASLARDIPGAEAAQAGARALVRGQSYTDARNDIRGAEESAPAPVRIGNRIIGGVMASAAMPGRSAGKALGPALQGVLYGAASGVTQSDPNAGVAQRLKDAGVDAVVGGAVGKVADATTNLVRSAVTSSLGTQALLRKAAMRTADHANYGAAEREAVSGGGTSPAVRDVLEHSQVKPLADDIRESFRMQGTPTDDASVLMQAHRELSQNERALIDRTANAASSRPLTAREQADVRAVKLLLREAASRASTKPPLTLDVAPETFSVGPRLTPGREPQVGPVGTGPLAARTTPPHPSLSQALRNFRGGSPNAVFGPDGPAFQLRGQAERVTPGVQIETPGMRVQTAPAELVPPLMPSFPRAVAEHARMQGEYSAFLSGADATKRLIGGASVAGKKLAKNSSEAFRASIPAMSPEEAEAALNGVLGRTKERIGLRVSPDMTTGFGAFHGFGIGPSLVNASKVSPFLQALERQMGGAPLPVDLIRALVASQGHPSP